MSNSLGVEDHNSFARMAVLSRSECDASNPVVSKKRRNPPGNPGLLNSSTFFHRAFCNALSEQNFSTTHSLATMVGSLHSQEHDILTHSIQTQKSPGADSRTKTSCSDPNKIEQAKTALLNPLMQANSTVLFDRGNMSMGSSFMSATALLQKAAEMGAKVSDNSTSPTMLKSYAGFRNIAKPGDPMPDIASSYTNNYGRCTESYSEASSKAGNGGFVPQNAGGWYGVMSPKRSGDGSRFGTAVDPFRTNGGEIEVRDSNRRRDGGEDNGERRNGRMTQDFLGLGATGSRGVGSAGGNQSCNNEDETLYTYNQMSNGPSTWGKYMWDY